MRGQLKVDAPLAVVTLVCLAMPLMAASICFVELNQNDEGKLYRVDPANPVPNLLLDLTGETFGMIRCPEFSPNGQWIAFSSEEDLMSTPWRSNLWITDRNGQGRFSVTHATPGSFPAGSPTGSVEGTVYEEGVGKSGAWVYISSLSTSVTADTWGHYRIDNVPVGEQWVTAYDPIILYDGEDFGFVPVTVYEGMTMPGDVTLTWDWDDQQGVNDISWRPNGTEVVFIDNAGYCDVIRADGSGLSQPVDLPEGVSQFDDVAVRPTTGELAFITTVWFGNDALEGLWLCTANGSNMRQIVSDDSYSKRGLHWSPDGVLLGYTTTVQDQQGNFVEGVLFYTDQGAFQGGVALDQGWYCEFGGWDPSQQYVCMTLYEGDYSQSEVVTIRLSDYSTTTLYGPGRVSFPSWGPEPSPVTEEPIGPSQVVLGPAFPNPARGAVCLQVFGSGAEPLNVGVFDLMGRRITTLRGSSVLTWDCRDAAGRPVPSGTYLFRLLRVAQASSREVVVIR